MFVLTALVYPCVLALLCVGAGLLVDRAGGGWLPGMLLGAVGAAALIAISQLSTYVTALAPATPYALAAVACAGWALGRAKVRSYAHEWRACRWQLACWWCAYLVALAPVLLAGRPTFSSFGILDDSAFHMLGADYLMRHGQSYAHLDLRSSYGQYIHAYYATGYPSGADTLFGGSAFILRAPLIWAMQPFNAFMLATAAGPAWVLARRIGLAGGWAALATLTATVPALVYGYELVASVKEIVALGMILDAGRARRRCTPAGCARDPPASSRSRSCWPAESRRSGSGSGHGGWRPWRSSAWWRSATCGRAGRVRGSSSR